MRSDRIRSCHAIAALLLLAACGSTPLDIPPALIGTQWRVEKLDGRNVPGKTPSTLQFTDSSAAGGTLGCNRFSTQYTQDGAYLKFADVAATRMACPPPVMEQEARFAGILEATRRIRKDGRDLLLLDASGKERARLEPMKR